jgi:glycosyltransferase involved in cell wall biosynthesis
MHPAEEAGDTSSPLDDERRAVAAARRSAAAAASEAERARLDLARAEAQLAAIRNSSTWRMAAILSRLIQAWPGLNRLVARLASPRTVKKNAAAPVRQARRTTSAPATASELGASADGIDLLVDLSESSLVDADLAGHVAALRARFAGVVVADGPAALATALAAAARQRRALAIVSGAWLPASELTAALAALSSLDPMIGSVQPRFAAAEDEVMALPGVDPVPAITLPRSALPFLPATYLTPELPAAMLLLSPQGVLAAEATDAGSFGEAVATLLIGLRRRGFRNLVANRLVAPFPLEPALAYPAAAAPDGEQARVRSWLANLPERRLELVLAGAFAADGRARLLLDCRGLVDRHNGTSQATLGLLEGFTQQHPAGLEITLVATKPAAQFHRLAARFPDFALRLDRPTGSYLACVLLNQPWSVERIAELHRCSLLILFNMLDTIAWDIVGPAPADLDQAWRLMARIADGLFFISGFTRERFAFRFPPDPAIPLVVTHLSLAADELAGAPASENPDAEPYLLVFGNSYDHKAVDPTLARLLAAFPATRIVALGAAQAPSPRVTPLRSGQLDEAEIDALIANAAAVIYPSFYEGFGLPVATGLACGRTVIVRRSPLWQEIADHCDLPGALVPYDDEAGLIEAVSRALKGLPAQGLAKGGALSAGAAPPRWQDCAARIGDLVERLIRQGDGRRWLDRETVLRGRAALDDRW